MKITLWVPLLLVTVGLSCSTLKMFYIGSSPLLIGKVGEYKVVFCETKHSVGSLISQDARGGFYRVYDSSSSKVFELFTAGFAFDVVTTGADSAEFQLDSGETHVWVRP